MRCRYCGQRIPEGELYCRHCGKEVRIVPDYNPLDDMLTAQIKGAIDGDEDIYNDSYTTRSTRNRNNRNAGRTAGAARNASGRNRNTSHSGVRQMSEEERRRRNRERARQKARRKKKKKRALLLALFLLLIIAREIEIIEMRDEDIFNDTKRRRRSTRK